MAGELLTQAEHLIKMGLHPSEILIGYEKGSKKALELLDTLTCFEPKKLREKDQLIKCINSTIAAKQFGL